MIERTEWTIAQLAREFGVTYRTLRFYEEKGIVKPLREGVGDRIRIYGQTDRWTIMAMIQATRLGFTIEEARDLKHHEGRLVLTPEQIATQAEYQRRICLEAKAAFLELFAMVDGPSPIPGEHVLEMKAA